MKKLIFLELIFLFLATTFSSNPPGWYQQTLPVNDNINDIFFLDSLNGWVVTDHQGGSDTSYILKTTNGGDNWEINYKTFVQFTTIQFVDLDIGYACGVGSGPEFFKSTNGGVNWNILNVITFTWKSDLSFINKVTGWVCSSDPFDGGVFKTTDGGISWIRQINYGTNNPDKIFFINTDTGWTSNGSGRKLYKTINGGMNWNLQYTHTSQINDIYFLNGDTGIFSGGVNYRTVDGGYNWNQSIGNVGGIKISIGKDSTGWAGSDFHRISKTTNNGISWGIQNSPIFNNSSSFAIDSLKAWAGGNGLVRTTDGGGLVMSVKQISTDLPSYFTLYQNYPNPFNPKTFISYDLQVTSIVILKIFNLQGINIKTLINQRQTPGEYRVEFDGSELASGIYFYQLETENVRTNQVFSETKKMILTK